MRAYMHFEGAQRSVGLLAVFAREMLLYLSTAMKLFVLGQTAKRGIALAAAVALIARYSRPVVDSILLLLEQR